MCFFCEYKYIQDLAEKVEAVNDNESRRRKIISSEYFFDPVHS